MNQVITAVFAAILFAAGFSSVNAEEDEKLGFAGYLEETLGHFWAIEQNLDDDNAELALVHATHPIAELYDSMKPELKEANPEFDEKVQQTLLNLGKKTGKDVTREDAQMAIDEAKEIIEEARTIVVGDELSNDSNFKAKLMIGLLSTSIGEYEEGVKNGQIELMAEFQDGSAFVWRSQQVFDEIKADLPEHEAEEIEELYPQIWQAYDDRADPEEVATLVNGVIHELEDITGEESDDGGLKTYFENIESLLTEANEEYAAGNSDEAISLATKAYLDNFEFLESPIEEQDEVLMDDLEVAMRQDLRAMMKNGASADDVSSQIDAILKKLEQAEDLVLVEESEDEEYEEHESMAPLKQVESGVAPEDVQCDDAMELVFKKSTGTPACVKPNTAERLIQLGWGTRQ
ncbi:MAG: PEFG-CTERM sorting domain-containing protein [Thaumarchaeota archaeon]|nr:PEFG-CTERM sorting domain-containing protein [Nitrososphaerota archaeon]